MSDWLDDLYSKNNYWFISRHPSFSKKFGLTDNEILTLDFIANKKKIYTYLLTIGLDFNDLDVIKKKLIDFPLANKIKERFSIIFNKKVHVILFDKNGEKFSVTDDFLKYKDMSSDNLIDYFYKIDKDLVKNTGTYKEINKMTSDSFHSWSRENISRYVVKNDMDIISIHPKMVFELKRVKEDIDTWTPYLDDLSNFRCMKKICSLNKIKFLLMSYGIERENEVAVHCLDKTNNDVICGRKVICNPNNIAIKNGSFFIPDDVGVYRSMNRRRQKYD